MNTLPCPLCGAHTTATTLPGHIERDHPQHCVHMLGVDLCPHLSIGLGMIHGPRRDIFEGAVPLSVN